MDEGIKGLTSFTQLPVEAKKYIAVMLLSLVDVAYPNGWENEQLPRIRFIGIGQIGEIISDLPPSHDLVTSASVELSAVL